MSKHWANTWYSPAGDEHFVGLGWNRLRELCGDNSWSLSVREYEQSIDKAVANLMRWCRTNCTSVPLPVNVGGTPGMVFMNKNDALMFKLTWG